MEGFVMTTQPWHIGERTIEAAGHTWTLRPVERGGALGFWIAESPHREDRFLPTVQACVERLAEREADGSLAHGGEAPAPVKFSVTCSRCRQRPATCGAVGGELVCGPCADGEPMKMDADEDTPALAYKEELEWLRGEVTRLEDDLAIERGAKAEWEQACQKQAESIDELLQKVGRREETIEELRDQLAASGAENDRLRRSGAENDRLRRSGGRVAELEGEVLRIKEQRQQETSRADQLACQVADLNEVLVRWQAVGNDFGITGLFGVPDEAKVARFKQDVCNNAAAAAEVARLRSSAEDFRKASYEVDDLHERLVTAFDAIARLEDQVDQLQGENGYWQDVNTEHLRAENERLTRALGRLLRHRQLERELRVCEDELGDLGVYIAAAANEPPANGRVS